MRILLIEDDAMVAQVLVAALRGARLAADGVQDGRTGEAALATGSYTAALLDLHLPCRQTHRRIPIANSVIRFTP